MVALTTRGSALHGVVGDMPVAGSLREQRAAELRAVLGRAGLSALLPALQQVVHTLAALKRLSVEQLQGTLKAKGGPTLSAGQRRQLSSLGLCAVSRAVSEEVAVPRAPQQMERD